MKKRTNELNSDEQLETWHLAETIDEMHVTEFELQLWRVFNGFIRWIEECERYVNGSGLNGYELSILHIIRMKDRPKSIADIGRLLNRTDNFNLQYSIKKLLQMGLIEKLEESPRYSKSTLYKVTAEGIKNTDNYTQARRNVLINRLIKESGLSLEEATQTIAKLKTIYDEAERTVTSKLLLYQI